MQILELKIDNYKCLMDFEIKFEKNDSGSSTVLIGENGTGKSSMMEAILRILAAFDSSVVAKERNFNFYLKYYYAGEFIIVKKEESTYSLFIEGSNYNISGSLANLKRKLKKDRKDLFPKRVIIFYSGTQNNLLPLYRKIDTYYIRKCRNTITSYINFISSKSVDDTFKVDFPDRKYNYCFNSMTPIYLASILLDISKESYERELLVKNGYFEKIESIDIVINLEKLNHIFTNDDKINVPERFWDILQFVQGSFVDLFRNSLLFRSNNKVYFALNKFDGLEMDRVSIFNAFEKLTILFNAQFDVTVKYGESDVRVSELSEGQQQLIRMLGMIGLFKHEDSFVIMDEPDAHMNPKWKYDLKNIIDECLKDATNTQALIATHDPLVINGVDKGFVRIFNSEMISGSYRTKVNSPNADTKGMGIDGLLQSEYYGLQTSYDKDTSDKYFRRNELYINLINDNIADEEKEELRKLTKELGSLPSSNNTIDFLYNDFIKEYKNTEYYTKKYLTFDEVESRRDQIKKIINKLFEGN